ncbi:MAG TPA: lytic transglycosylase domain-containing protein [Thermoleophilaceae bacterium]
MSVSTVEARISQLEAMIASAGAGSPSPASTSTSTSATSFDQQLATAQAATATDGTSSTATTGTTDSGSGSVPYEQLIDTAASKYGVDPAVLKGLIKQESGFNPSAGSPAGAQGLTQLMPGTASAMGVTNLHDPAQSIDGGAHYLKMQLDRFGGDYSKALAAYNAGPGAVQRYNGIPPYAETQNYVKNVLAFAQQYRQDGGTAAVATQSQSNSYSTV